MTYICKSVKKSPFGKFHLCVCQTVNDLWSYVYLISICIYLCTLTQNDTVEFEYSFGFAYCISANLMKDMEPFFRFETKTDCLCVQVGTLDLFVFFLIVKRVVHKKWYVQVLTAGKLLAAVIVDLF